MGKHSDLINDQFDFELTGAILLGRDIAAVAAPQTLKFLINILEEEIKNDENSKLISDMMIDTNILSVRDDTKKYLSKILNNLLIGINA